jgi:hypothetical protein
MWFVKKEWLMVQKYTVQKVSRSLKDKVVDGVISVLLQPFLGHRKILELDFIFFFPTCCQTIPKGPQNL